LGVESRPAEGYSVRDAYDLLTNGDDSQLDTPLELVLQEFFNIARNYTEEISFLAMHGTYRGNFPR